MYRPSLIYTRCFRGFHPNDQYTDHAQKGITLKETARTALIQTTPQINMSNVPQLSIARLLAQYDTADNALSPEYATFRNQTRHPPTINTPP